jgi:hypothetical protein
MYYLRREIEHDIVEGRDIFKLSSAFASTMSDDLYRDLQ